MITTIISIIILSISAYIALGLRIIKKKEFVVIERLGKFKRIARAGMTVLCLPGIIDSEKYKGHLKFRRLDLYADEKNNQIDFKDGSCPVNVQVWWKIGDLDIDIQNFVYVSENPENKLEEMVDAFARPKLQEMTIDIANTEKDKVSTEVNNDLTIKRSLSDIGIYLDPLKGCLITDIVLTSDIIDIRKKEMEGTKEASKAEKKGTGYARAITAIMESARDANSPITFQEAREIYEKQRGLETISDTKSNIQFVSPDIQGLMMTLGIGQTGQKMSKSEGGNP